MGTKTDILNAVIIGYREVVSDRYQFDKIDAVYELPSSFDSERVDMFRSYFLDALYPHPEKRAELNEAFESLDSYIKSPNKLLQLLVDSTKLLFKFGRHLPKILSAGLKALGSFRTASSFENKMVIAATKAEYSQPYSKTDMLKILSALPKKDVLNYLENNEEMFEIMHDQTLVGKIIEVIDFLISKMKQKPDIYSEVEINGLSVGRQIIADGNQLFSSLPKEDQPTVFALAAMIERDFWEAMAS